MKVFMHLTKYSEKYLMKSFSLTHNTHTTIYLLKTSNQPTTLQKKWSTWEPVLSRYIKDSPLEILTDSLEVSWSSRTKFYNHRTTS